MRKSAKYIGLLSLFVIVGAGIFFLVPKLQNKRAPELSILSNCFSNTTTSRYSPPDEECLKKSVDNLLQTYKTTDLMNYIVATTTRPDVSAYCHDVAHIVGEETFIKSGDIEGALNECSRKCDAGCVHGVIAAGIAKDLGAQYLNEDIVHANPARVEEFGAKYCYQRFNGLCHAIGHILYIGSQDIPVALQGCAKIAPEMAARENCNQGVFMEASGDVATFVKSTTTADRIDNDYSYPCDSVGAPYQHACLLYLANFQKQLFVKNNIIGDAQLKIARTVCESFTDTKTRSDCFLGFGRSFLNPDSPGGDDPYRPAICETLSGTDQDSCIVGLAVKFGLHNRYKDAFNYCSARSNEKRVEICYNVIFQIMLKLSFKDTGVNAACNASNVADECKKQYARFLPIADSVPQYYLEGLF